MKPLPLELRQNIYRQALIIHTPAEPSSAITALSTFQALRRASRQLRADLEDSTININLSFADQLLEFANATSVKDFKLIENISVQYFGTAHMSAWANHFPSLSLTKFQRIQFLRIGFSLADAECDGRKSAIRLSRVIEPMIPDHVRSVQVILDWNVRALSNHKAGLILRRNLHHRDETSSMSFIYTPPVRTSKVKSMRILDFMASL